MNRFKVTDWSASIGIFLAHIGNFIYMPLLLSILGSTYSGFWAGFVLFMTYVGRVTATFCYTSISQQFSMRNIVAAFVLLEGLALLAMGFTNSILAYSFLAFFVGYGSGISFPALKHLLSNLPETYRVSAFSRFQLSAQGGLVIGALIGSFWSNPQMPSVFIFTFLLFLCYALAIFFLIPKERISITSPHKLNSFFDFSLLKSARFMEIKYDLFISMFYWILIMSFMVNMPLHIQKYMSSLSVSMPFWLTGSILLVLQMPLSKYINKHFGSSLVMSLGCIALLCGFLLFSFSFTLLNIVGGCIMIAFGQILFAPALDLHVAKRVSKDNMAKAMSSMHFYRSVGNMIGTFCAGIFFDLGHYLTIYNLSWIVMSIIASFLVVGSLVLVNKRFYVAQQYI